MKGTNINLATNIKWIASIPFQMIDEDFNSNNTAFNLTSFNIPEMEIGSTETSYMGTEVSIPTFNRIQTKEITFEYIMSEDFHQYIVLYNWLTKISQEIGSGSNVEKLADVVLPIRVLMLSAFKTPLFEIIYHNCWLRILGDLSLDYQDPNASNVRHSFTCNYTHFTFNKTPTTTNE